MKTFNTQVCTTKEQSKRLLELGLKKETADCRWLGLVKDVRGNDIPTKKQVWFTRTNEDEHAMVCGHMRYDFIPAWSLDSLLNLLPINIEWNNNDFDLILRHAFCYMYHNDTKGIMVSIGNSNRFDGTISLIEWLIQEGYFNKEYLEE